VQKCAKSVQFVRWVFARKIGYWPVLTLRGLSCISQWPVLIYCNPMTDDAEAAKFRNQADECREWAAKAISTPDKESWLRLAEEWLKLAMNVEGRKP
jgi:hypothetical protein